MRRRFALSEKYALLFGALVGAVLAVAGVLEIYLAYRTNRLALVELQHEKAEAAAGRIGQYLFDIERQLSLTGDPRPGRSALQSRAAELQLLRRGAAVRDLWLLDQNGHEVLRLSRRAPDLADSGQDFSATDLFRTARTGRSYRSDIVFREGTPQMTLALPVGPPEAGITVAVIDLEFLLDGISRIKVGADGQAYAVNKEGVLIAHPEMGLVNRQTNLAHLPQVRAAISDPSRRDGTAVDGYSARGEPVLAGYSSIPQLGWTVFVEEPLSEALRPLMAQVWRSTALSLGGAVVTVLAAVLLVRRLVSPIQRITIGAALLGQGALDHRIVVETGDEFEELGAAFNHMAEQLQTSYAELEHRVAERTLELEKLNQKLTELSSTDPLTGLANRRRFDEVLAVEWNRAARLGLPLAVGLLDVDWFKRYNDHYGHQAGDECLRTVARVFAAQICRSGDLVARYGGEEFIFIAPATDAAQALVMAQRVCDALESLRLPHVACEIGYVTVSIGVDAMVPSEGVSPEALLHAADLALYSAKRQGRNRVVQAGGSEG